MIPPRPNARGSRPLAAARGIARATGQAPGLDSQNLIANGTFGSSTGWVLGTNWTIAAGVLTATIVLAAGQVASTTYTANLVQGGVYRVQFDMASTTLGSVKFQFTGGATINGSTRSADGTYSEDVTATAAETGFQFIAVADYTGNIDNLSVRRIA